MKKYENKTGWIQPPTVPFGGSQLDHKLAAEKIAANPKKPNSFLSNIFKIKLKIRADINEPENVSHVVCV